MSRVTINLTGFEDHLDGLEHDQVISMIHDQERKQHKGVTPQHIADEARELFGDAPEIRAYLKDPFTRKPNSAAGNLFTKIQDFWREHSKDPMDPLGDKAFAVMRLWHDILDPNDMRSEKEIEAEAARNTKAVMDGTRKNAERVKRLIEQAVKRCHEWAGEPIAIRPNYDRNSDDWILEPQESFYVEIGQGSMSPGFMIFMDGGKLDSIDDVLESGDRDFFHKPHMEMDYFNLIRELEQPGSTRKEGKNLTLWTARPTKDRHLYQGAKHVPTNIFLTTDMHRASGIAHDLGANEVRDVWKMIINEKYLMKTLEAGRIRDYQTIGRKQVPVVRTVLFHQGESMDFRQAGETLGKLCEEMGLESFDESRAVMHWVRQKFGAAKAAAHRAFVKMVRKDPAAHRQKMRADKRYHRTHKWHDALMRKTRRPGFARRHLRAHVENPGLQERDPGQAFMDVPFELRVTSGAPSMRPVEESFCACPRCGHRERRGSKACSTRPCSECGRKRMENFVEAASPDSMQVQTLIFSKTRFNRGSAVKWAINHDFSAAKVDEKANTFRIRQRDPDDFADATFRTITLTNGVKAVVAKAA